MPHPHPSPHHHHHTHIASLHPTTTTTIHTHITPPHHHPQRPHLPCRWVDGANLSDLIQGFDQEAAAVIMARLVSFKMVGGGSVGCVGARVGGWV